GLTACPASASDYLNTCDVADQRFTINDDMLTAKSDNSQTEIPYTVLSKSTTAERQGYCEAAGQRYPFEARNSVQRIRFEYAGSQIETTATCEFAADGLPASLNCEREVVTLQRGDVGQFGAQPLATSSTWDHNGSEMRLESDGRTRRFVYQRPRPGMQAAGARPGDILFEGQRTGSNYAGTAYIFSKRCGKSAYAVAGSVQRGEKRVVLKGRAPRLGNNCQRTGMRADTLVFDYISR
ncbi:MAG: hypothetical protein AAGF32_07960, partial [Pseudomonadota bacterium]